MLRVGIQEGGWVCQGGIQEGGVEGKYPRGRVSGGEHIQEGKWVSKKEGGNARGNPCWEGQVSKREGCGGIQEGWDGMGIPTTPQPGILMR